MSKERVGDKEGRDFERNIVAEYLKYGSVDEIFRANNYELPVSYPGVYHILNRWGVVRSVGRANTPLSECLGFLVRMVEEKIPLETLYKKMPPSFTPSMTTLHTVYRRVKKEVRREVQKRDMRRTGTALVISPEDNPHEFLIGRDVSAPRLDVGKPYGSVSLPMGFSKRGEGKKAILRVLQQEVFSDRLLQDPESFSEFANGLVEGAKPFMYLDIADVRVAVFHLEVPVDAHFSSFKLKNYRFASTQDINSISEEENLLREGILEISEGYGQYRESLQGNTAEISFEPFYKTSLLNKKLMLLSSQ